MDPRDLTTAPWMTSAIEQLEAARPWTANLKSLEDNAAKITGLNVKGSAAAVDAAAIYDSIPDASQMITGAIPNAASIISGSIPDVPGMITGTIPDASTAMQGFVPDPVKTITGSVPDASAAFGSIPDAGKMISRSVSDLASVVAPGDPKWAEEAQGAAGFTAGSSLDELQRASAAFTNLGVASKSPAYGGTFYSAKKRGVTVVPRGLLPPEQRAPVVPQSGRGRPPLEPQELGEEIAPNVVRRHRQEAKGLLVLLGLDLALEHLESVERRLLDGRRPERVQAALSASLLLAELADELFPPRTGKRVDRYGVTREVAAKNVKNRLHAFADPYFEDRPVEEHKLLIAEFDFIYRWTGKGHHVVFNASENEEAYCALLKVLATVARAHRFSQEEASESASLRRCRRTKPSRR